MLEPGLQPKQRQQELHSRHCQRLKTKFFKKCSILVEINTFNKRDFEKKDPEIPVKVFIRGNEIFSKGMKIQPVVNNGKNSSKKFLITESDHNSGFSFFNIIEAYNTIRSREDLDIQDTDVEDIIRQDSENIKDDTFLIKYKKKYKKENIWDIGSFKVTVKYKPEGKNYSPNSYKGSFKKNFEKQRQNERMLRHIDKMKEKYSKK